MFATLSLLAFASVAVAAPIGSRDVNVIGMVESAVALPTTIQSSNASWYLQAGNAGACGLYSEDSDLVAGLPLSFYNNTGSVSSYCGAYIVIKNPLNNVTVTSRVADASGSPDVLSLSVASWRALDGDATDLATVTWSFANKTQTAEAIAALNASSSAVSVSTASSTSVVESSSTETTTSAYVAPTSTYVAPATTTYTPTSTYEAPTSTYVAPTTTWTPTTSAYVEAAATTAASSSSSGTYSGEATYFFQNGVAGACGNVNSDSAYIVAIDSAMYSSSLCGKSLTISGNGKSVTATVADECPSCASSGSIDLSVGAFTALADESAGVVEVTWSWN